MIFPLHAEKHMGGKKGRENDGLEHWREMMMILSYCFPVLRITASFRTDGTDWK
jgi:hypothetical protein